MPLKRKPKRPNRLHYFYKYVNDKQEVKSKPDWSLHVKSMERPTEGHLIYRAHIDEQAFWKEFKVGEIR